MSKCNNPLTLVATHTMRSYPVQTIPQWVTKKVLICPMDLPLLRGDRVLCHQICGAVADKYEEEAELKMTIVQRCMLLDLKYLDPHAERSMV